MLLCVICSYSVLGNIFLGPRSVNSGLIMPSNENWSYNGATYSAGKLVFPNDEGDKDTRFDWWYMTAHFVTKTGKKFSYTAAYFGNDPTYYTRQTAILDETNKIYYRQSLNGKFTSQKYLLNLTYSNSNGDQDYWYQKEDELFNYILYTEIDELYALNVTLSSNKPPLIHGGDGIIPMGHGGDSYYYSLTNLTLNGTFVHDGIIEPVYGFAWIDRQWGDWAHTGYGFDGWEWFALQLNDNTEIMLYLFFDVKTGKMITPTLSIMFSDGSSVDLSDEKKFDIQYLDYWEAPDEHLNLKSLFFKQYFSSGWKLTILKYRINLTITPIIKNQRVSETSWEGSCYVNGTYSDVPIDGVSTVELTHRYSEPDYLKISVACILFFLMIGIAFKLVKSKVEKYPKIKNLKRSKMKPVKLSGVNL